MHYNPVRRMRYVMQHRLIHIGPLARIKVGGLPVAVEIFFIAMGLFP